MGLEKYNGKMGKAMKGNIWMIRNMGKVLLYGVVGKSMLEVGSKESSMDWECRYLRIKKGKLEFGRMERELGGFQKRKFKGINRKVICLIIEY